MAFGNVGTGIQQPPAQLLGTMNAITQKYVIPSLGDAVLKPSPAFWGMTKKGVKLQGGELVYPILTQEETTGGAYYGDQLLNTAVVDSIQPATQVWRPYYQSVAIPVTDAILNRGSAGVLDLMETKFEISCGSLLQKLSRALWGTAPQNTAIDIDNIPAWVKSTTNTIAGIDRSLAANSWFLPGTQVNNTVTPLTQANAEKAYQNVVFGYDEPDLMLIAQQSYAGFKNTFTPNIRYDNNIQDEEVLQAGFRYHFMFNNAVVMPDLFVSTIDATHADAYILNTKYIYPVFHENDYFNVDPFVKPSNQRVVVSQIFVTWQLINQSPRMSVNITNV